MLPQAQALRSATAISDVDLRQLKNEILRELGFDPHRPLHEQRGGVKGDRGMPGPPGKPVRVAAASARCRRSNNNFFFFFFSLLLL